MVSLLEAMAVEFLTTEEIAKELKVCTETVRRFIRRGELPVSRFGKFYRIKRTDYERFKKRHEVKQ